MASFDVIYVNGNSGQAGATGTVAPTRLRLHRSYAQAAG
jgi:hypothetical protein